MKTHGIPVAVLSVLVLTGPLSADAVDSREVILGLNSVILARDLAALHAHYGAEGTHAVRYLASITSTGWQTTMDGMILGNAFQAQYTGVYTQVGSIATMSYTATGSWGGDAWSGDGNAVIYEPVFETTTPPGIGFSIGLDGSISVSGGYGPVGATLEKNFVDRTMSLEVNVGAGGAEVGVGMSLNQATGVDQGYAYGSCWGMKVTHNIGDATQAYSCPGGGGLPDLPVVDPCAPPSTWAPWDPPALPFGATAGTEDLQPGEVLYDAGYIGCYATPEPATLLLLALGGLSLLRRRKS